MNLRTTVQRLPLAAMMLVLAATSAPRALAAGKPILGTAKGYLKLELEREAWSADEPILGRMIFEISEVRDRSGIALNAVVLNGPYADIAMPDGMPAAPTMVRFRSPLSKTIKVGHRYELSFALKMDETFYKLLETPDVDYQMFNPGKFKIGATISSPPRAPWEQSPKSIFTELFQQFESQPIHVTILPSGGAPPIRKRQITDLIDTVEPDVKQKIITFYAKRGVLTQEELLEQVVAASGRMKAELASFWLSMNLPVGKLDFFEPAGASLSFKSIEDGPVYMMLRPQQRIRVSFDVREVHRFRVADIDRVITTRTDVDVTAPRAPGVYEMYDEAHRQPWGWILVHRDDEAIAQAGLRPDTSELSAKVAAALHERDADALEALAVPGFRASEVIRELRFKLGEGDIRYVESTGTSNNVRTRMKINLAPAGQEPVFARELILEYVLVGQELKLRRAAALDVDP